MVVVLDTNVIVSAFQFGGQPGQVVDMVRARELNAAISPSILGEVTRVLGDKFEWSPAELKVVTGILMRSMKLVEPIQKLTVVPGDPNDNHVVEAAVTAGAEAIITGDKDLLRMGSYEGIRMLKVADVLQGRGSGRS